MNYDKLYKNLGYQFNDVALLEKALTHRSVSSRNNERLEFLGDSIVNFVIGEALFQQFPNIDEGQLSRMRSHLVKKETLAIVAQQLNLSDFLRLGSGELKSGGFRRESILADAVEAIIAAIYNDSSLDKCKQHILVWYADLLKNISSDISHKDSKTKLQEILQAQHMALPVYDIVKTEGQDHQQTFYIKCSVKDLHIEKTASGSNRRRAEQAAAKAILQEITS